MLGNDETRGREIPITVAGSPGPEGDPSDQEVEAMVVEATEEPESGPEVDEVEALQKQYEEEHDRHLRAVAELHNYRRRVAQERAQQLQFANEQLLSALLPVLDHFEMALEHSEADPKAFQQGVAMILQQLRDVTSSHGLEAVPTAGQLFDPERHEALMRIETDELCEGMIVGEVRKGYILNGRIVRAAQVKVAVPPKQQDTEG